MLANKNAADERAMQDRDHQVVVEKIEKKVESKEDKWAKKKRQYE